MSNNDKASMQAAALVVAQQAADDPLTGVPVDPELADFMGAFTEDALTLADLMDDVLLTANEQGEMIYGGE